MANTACQPPRASSVGAAKAEPAAPTDIPHAMIAISIVRLRVGAYSAVSASALGRLVPSPTPVSRRQVKSSVGV